jgi:large conductance mechanosensitive channel
MYICSPGDLKKDKYMSLIKEFKEFAMKGNVVDMAVGVVIGAGFGKIVSSLVADVITPPLGFVIGGVDFTNLKLVILEAAGQAPAVTINYGKFIQSIFDFTIMAAALFSVIKVINKLKKSDAAAEAAVAEPPAQEKLLTEIRDILKAK